MELFGKEELELLNNFYKRLFSKSNPIGINELLYYSGIFEHNNMRSPLVPMDNVIEIGELHDAYDNLN